MQTVEPHNTQKQKSRLIGMNHIALEVGNLEEALAFYGRLFSFTLRGRHAGMVFIDLGDQFLALVEERAQPPDRHRHCGLVVDDRQAVAEALQALGVEILPGPGLDFRDPWGNRIQVVQYSEIQFTKAPEVLKGMGVAALEKSAAARQELAAKGMASE